MQHLVHQRLTYRNLRNEIQRMLEMARVNVEESFDAFLAGSSKFLGDVDKREDYIDYTEQRNLQEPQQR